MMNNDFRTLGYILKRTNYGEADRILNIITPKGKIVAIAKGSRREKSKLAGGIEMFSLVDLNIHQGKSDFALITGAKMIKYFSNILKDLEKLELASMFLKKINQAADSSPNDEYFNILDQSLSELNNGTNLELVESWFLLNLTQAIGEEINLYRNSDGEKLVADDNYNWNVSESSFSKKVDGEYGADEIKMLRLMISTNLTTVKKVKIDRDFLQKILRFSRIVARM